MKFVNIIAEIVHGATVRHFGLPNKNVGDAFLLVWKFQTDEEGVPTKKSVATMSDCALMAFLEVLEEIDKSEPLNTLLSKSKKLQERFPNYKTKFGFGLHRYVLLLLMFTNVCLSPPQLLVF